MKVSIIIVNWNTSALLRRCLHSIEKMTAGVSYEVIVVDNASTDDTVAMITRDFPTAKLVVNKQNLGFSKANNIGLKYASGDYILYLNPDTEILTHAVLGMATCLDHDCQVGAVGCKLIGTSGNIQNTCACTLPTLTNEICYLFFLNHIFPSIRFFSSSELEYWDHNNSAYVNCLSGACLMARRNIIWQLAGFDERLFMYAEDLDLCFRISKAGWRIYYLANETILHFQGASSSKRNSAFAILRQRESIYYYFCKNYGMPTALLYRLATLVGSAFRVFCGIILTPILISIDCSIKPVSILAKYSCQFLWAIGIRRP